MLSKKYLETQFNIWFIYALYVVQILKYYLFHVRGRVFKWKTIRLPSVPWMFMTLYFTRYTHFNVFHFNLANLIILA